VTRHENDWASLILGLKYLVRYNWQSKSFKLTNPSVLISDSFRLYQLLFSLIYISLCCMHLDYVICTIWSLIYNLIYTNSRKQEFFQKNSNICHFHFTFLDLYFLKAYRVTFCRYLHISATLGNLKNLVLSKDFCLLIK
jgi:hypothetical protein